MLKRQIKELIVSSTILTVLLYGSWHLLTDIITTFLPIGIILFSIIALSLYFLHIPAPSPEMVEAIFGKEPHLVREGTEVLRTVAHRGAGLDAPENSLAAFKMCSDNGINAIEFDVTLTADEVPIVFHDDTLERMTGLSEIINQKNWSDLCDIDISVKHVFKDRFANTNIPTLEQTVTQLLACGQRMFIDIKDNNRKIVPIIHKLFEKQPELYSRAVVTSFFPNIIYFIRKGDPKIVCSMAWRPSVFTAESYSYPQGEGRARSKSWYHCYFNRFCDAVIEWALPRIIYYLLGLSIVLLHKDVITAQTVIEWRRKGVRVMAWTVNSPAEKQYFARALKITYLTDTLTGEGSTHQLHSS